MYTWGVGLNDLMAFHLMGVELIFMFELWKHRKRFKFDDLHSSFGLSFCRLNFFLCCLASCPMRLFSLGGSPLHFVN